MWGLTLYALRFTLYARQRRIIFLQNLFNPKFFNHPLPALSSHIGALTIIKRHHLFHPDSQHSGIIRSRQKTIHSFQHHLLATGVDGCDNGNFHRCCFKQAARNTLMIKGGKYKTICLTEKEPHIPCKSAIMNDAFFLPVS